MLALADGEAAAGGVIGDAAELQPAGEGGGDALVRRRCFILYRDEPAALLQGFGGVDIKTYDTVIHRLQRLIDGNRNAVVEMQAEGGAVPRRTVVAERAADQRLVPSIS